MEKEIRSPTNPTIKRLVRLRERKERERERRILIEGRREIALALDGGIKPDSVYVCEALFSGVGEREILEKVRAGSADVVRVAPRVFQKIAFGDRAEGLLATAPLPRRALAGLSATESALFVVVEAVEKPGNLGAILRSCDGAGADGVIVCDRATDVYNPNVIRASIGTVFSVPVVQAETGKALAWLLDRGIRIIAATPHAETDYTRADFRGPTAIAVGSEAGGLSPACLEAAAAAVRVPMRGRADSLNVATTASLLLYEAVRQRSLKEIGA